MIDFDPSTPQLKAVKRTVDAYSSLDMNNIAQFLAKDYQYETFPKSIGFPLVQTKESHLQVWGSIFSLVKKLDVRIRHWRTAFRLPGADIHHP